MEKGDKKPPSGLARAFGGVARTVEAIKASLYAAIASVLIGLGLSAALSVAVSRLLANSLDAAKNSSGVNLVDTFSMFLGSHLITVHTRSHAAFLNVDVTLRAGLIILLLVPLVGILAGTTLFTWRFRTRALLPPAVYAGLSGLFYAVLLALIALLTHGRMAESFVSGVITGVLFALPGAYVGLRRPAPKSAAPPVEGEVPQSELADSETSTGEPAEAPPTPTPAPQHPTDSSWLPAVGLGARTLGWEFLGLIVLSVTAFAIDGSLLRSLLLVPNVAVYALAFLHGPTVSVVSNLQRIGSTSLSLVTGLTGTSWAATYNSFRFLLILLPVAAMVVGGIVLERRRKLGRTLAAIAFGLGYGALGGLLVWACSIRLEASGAAVALLAESGAVHVLLGAPWLAALLLMSLAATVLSYVGASVAGRKLGRAAVVLLVGLVCLTGVSIAAPRVSAVLSGLFRSHAVTFSLGLPDLQQCTALIEQPGGGYILAGYAASDPARPMVLALDANGAKLWAETPDLTSLAGPDTGPAVPPVASPSVNPSASQPTSDAGDSTAPTRSASSRDSSVPAADDELPAAKFAYHWTVGLVAVAPDGDVLVAGTRLGLLLSGPAQERVSLQAMGPAADYLDPYVARLDNVGRALWVSIWRDPTLPGPSAPVALAVQPDGTGKLTLQCGPLGDQKAVVVQVAPEGKLTQLSVGDAATLPVLPSFQALKERGCVTLSAVPLSRGGTITCGYIVGADAGQAGQSAFLALVDGSGKVRWLRSPSFTDMPALSQVQPTADGGYVAVGIRGSTAWLIKTDKRGLIEFEGGWK